METYENKIAIESCVKTIHKQQCTEHKVQSIIGELEMTYDKAKAWDRLYDMILDEDMTVREFDDEMYELLKQTGKTDIRIITDPSIRMEDE